MRARQRGPGPPTVGLETRMSRLSPCPQRYAAPPLASRPFGAGYSGAPSTLFTQIEITACAATPTTTIAAQVRYAATTE